MSRLTYIQQKISNPEKASKLVEGWKMKNEKVVFTNGCFDILHKGHVTYLAKAADLGQRLVVGLNTDASVKRQNKGDNRPVNDESARETVLASLACVDLVVRFDEDTPYELISALKPDILVKGADYDPGEKDPSAKKYIVGSDLVRKSGGEVRVIDLEEGFSTTSIIRKAKN